MGFRDNLIHLRSTNNMTQEQLAVLLGVSRQSVTKWEAEKSSPEMDKLIKICKVFDCTLDELVQGDLTDREASPSVVIEQGAKPEDVFGYDEFMNRFARRIAWGVAAPIVGIALFVWFLNSRIVFASFIGILPKNVDVALGMLCFFASVALCLWMIIPAGLDHSTFVKAHPHVEDFYTEDQKTHTRKAFSYQLVGGIAAILLGICIVIVFADTAYEEILGLPLMLLCIALGTGTIVHGGIEMGKINIAQYNYSAGEVMDAIEIERSNLTDEQKDELLKVNRADKKVGAVCGTIMIIATIAGLVMLFVPSYATPLFWLAWPIGGLLCGIASLLIKGFGRE